VPVRIIFMGTPDFAVPILKYLLCSSELVSESHVVAAYTQPDKQAGRGRRVIMPPVKRLAMENSILVIQPETLKSTKILEEMAGLRPELVVVAAYGHILPQAILSLPKFGCLNVHPSLLPRHRGPSPVANAILCGDESTGVTIMLMDAGMDSGPILAQRKVNISPEDTTGVLTSRLAKVGGELLLETLPKWTSGKLEPRPQDEREATYSKPISKNDAEIDWHLPAMKLWLRLRAYNPWPGCHTLWKGKRLRVLAAVALSDVVKGRVGEVVALPKGISAQVGVVTGEGILGLCQIQLEGKRQMSVKEFVLGQRDFIGSILSSLV